MTPTEPTLRVLMSPTVLPDAPSRDEHYLVVDVLRACTTVAHALAAKALGVIPVGSVEDATRLAATLDRETTILCGERQSLRIEGFDVGNSPAEMTEEAVGGKTIVLSTTNGARTMATLQSAQGCVAASLTTLSACVAHAAAFDQVTIVCAGSEGCFAREDFFCAGCLAAEIERSRPGVRLDDGARTAIELAWRHRDRPEEVIAESDHGRRLAELGFERDLALAAEIDRFAFVPVLRDGRLVPETGEQTPAR
jgi:2-phosphosulfolactate phosphatase